MPIPQEFAREATFGDLVREMRERFDGLNPTASIKAPGASHGMPQYSQSFMVLSLVADTEKDPEKKMSANMAISYKHGLTCVGLIEGVKILERAVRDA